MSSNQTQQPPSDGLPPMSVDDLLKMIGDRDVTIQRQGQLIALQTARLAELEQGNGQAGPVTPDIASAGDIQ